MSQCLPELDTFHHCRLCESVSNSVSNYGFSIEKNEAIKVERVEEVTTDVVSCVIVCSFQTVIKPVSTQTTALGITIYTSDS